MRRYRLNIAYDGTRYSGWQIQPNGPSIQEEIEKAILRLTGERVKLHGSGRTDAGVHARAQIAHLDLRKDYSPKQLQRGLNAMLPPDIRIMKAAHASSSFHARRSAKSKEYRYFIWNAEVLPPFERHFYAHIRRPLNLTAMRRAARYLVGQHDFAAFTANANRPLGNTVRRLAVLSVRKNGAKIVVRAVADGFLYRMVRSLVGFLLRVGEGAVPPEASAEILASRSRTARVPTAPPQGLFLWNVRY